MTYLKGLYAQSDAILAIIDRGEWKHSWHLPKGQNGYIDWFSPATAKQVVRLVKEAEDEAINLLACCRKIDLRQAHKLIKEESNA